MQPGGLTRAIFERDRAAPALAEQMEAREAERGAHRVDLGDEAFDRPVRRIAGRIGKAAIELIVQDDRSRARERGDQRHRVRVAAARAAVDTEQWRGTGIERAVDARIQHSAAHGDAQFTIGRKDGRRNAGAGERNGKRGQRGREAEAEHGAAAKGGCWHRRHSPERAGRPQSERVIAHVRPPVRRWSQHDGGRSSSGPRRNRHRARWRARCRAGRLRA